MQHSFHSTARGLSSGHRFLDDFIPLTFCFSLQPTVTEQVCFCPLAVPGCKPRTLAANALFQRHTPRSSTHTHMLALLLPHTLTSTRANSASVHSAGARQSRPGPNRPTRCRRRIWDARFFQRKNGSHPTFPSQHQPFPFSIPGLPGAITAHFPSHCPVGTDPIPLWVRRVRE